MTHSVRCQVFLLNSPSEDLLTQRFWHCPGFRWFTRGGCARTGQTYVGPIDHLCCTFLLFAACSLCPDRRSFGNHASPCQGRPVRPELRDGEDVAGDEVCQGWLKHPDARSHRACALRRWGARSGHRFNSLCVCDRERAFRLRACAQADRGSGGNACRRRTGDTAAGDAAGAHVQRPAHEAATGTVTGRGRHTRISSHSKRYKRRRSRGILASGAVSGFHAGKGGDRRTPGAPRSPCDGEEQEDTTRNERRRWRACVSLAERDGQRISQEGQKRQHRGREHRPGDV